MRGRRASVAAALAMWVLVGCATDRAVHTSTTDLRRVVDGACFEVVVKRVKTDSLTYERALPLELLPYNVRSDDYIPVGTAFAVARDRLISAAHVLMLLSNSQLYVDAYVRDSTGRLYPIDSIISFNYQKDFVVFTAKGISPTRYLRIRSSIAVDEPVYSVGNIYGQGVVVVPGNIVGTFPETWEGRWDLIKSSPPIAEGSSGGPLLDRNLDVVGVITGKDSSFCYSLPMSEVMNEPEGVGVFHSKITFAFTLLPGRLSEPTIFDLSVNLPRSLSDVRKTAHSAYVEHCRNGMDQFLAGEQMFPEGPGSAHALQTSTNSPGVQVLVRDKDDGKWYYSDLQKAGSSLPGDGALTYALLGNTLFMDLVKPDDVSHVQLDQDPTLVMDLILKGINLPRIVAGHTVRIVSLGTPSDQDKYEDAFGRRWDVHLWQLEHSDEVAILFHVPTPDGRVCMLHFCEYSSIDTWMYDLRKMADLVYVPYCGTLEQWVGFLQRRPQLSPLMQSVRVQYLPSDTFRLDTVGFQLVLDESLFSICDKMHLALMYDWYLEGDRVVWGLRRVQVNERVSDNYAVAYRFIKPPDTMESRYLQEWQDFARRRHPYDEQPSFQSGVTGIGGVHPSLRTESMYGYSLYLGREGSVAPERMREDFRRLLNAFRILP